MSRRVEILAKALNDVGATSFAEVGVWKGELAAQIIKTTDLKVYYMIDDYRNPNDQDKREQARRVAESDPRFRIIDRRSTDAANMFANGELDAAYIDACHDYENAAKDIEAFWPKVSKLLCGHDYISWNTCTSCPVGVTIAVEHFALANNLQVQIDDNPSGSIDLRLEVAYKATLNKCPTGDSFPSWYIRKSR